MTAAIDSILNTIDTAIQSYVFDGYAALSDALSPAITLFLTAYVAFVGWMSLHAWENFSSGNLVKHTMRVVMVMMIATHWDFFSTMIYDVVTNGPNEIANILVNSSHESISGNNQALQTVFDNGITKANDVWKEGGPLSKIYYLASMCITIFTYLSVGLALLEITVAKCGVGLTVVLAPLFSLGLLSKSTRGFFSSWLHTVLGFALVPIVLTSVMMIMNPILQSGLDAINPQEVGNGFGCLSTFILGSIACSGLVLKSAQMAASMAGGISVSAMEALSADSFGTGIGMMKMMGKSAVAPFKLGLAAARWKKNRGK